MRLLALPAELYPQMCLFTDGTGCILPALIPVVKFFLIFFTLGKIHTKAPCPNTFLSMAHQKECNQQWNTGNSHRAET